MANVKNFSEITPEIKSLAALCRKCGKIEQELYTKYDVKRGLRDLNGEGVLTGLTHISEIRSSVIENGQKRPCDGSLFYRGININDLVNGFLTDNRFGYEEPCISCCSENFRPRASSPISTKFSRDTVLCRQALYATS